MIGAEALHARGWLGQGVRIGIIDSGVNPHPAFGERLLPGHNYVTDAPDPDNTADSYGHGTRVAGLAAGAGDKGYYDVAPLAEIVPLKVTDAQSLMLRDLCAAIYGGVDDYGCNVLNISSGSLLDDKDLREAVAYANSRGVVVIASAGNAGTETVYYPAGYDTVIGVGAVDRDGKLYARSNRNGSVLVTAPGVAVRSASAWGGYTDCIGTSYAAPLVAGAAAALLSADPTLTPEDVRLLLSVSAQDRGDPGRDDAFGCGIVDLAACAQALSGPPCAFAAQENGAAQALVNRTDAPLRCLYLLTEYDISGRCLGVSSAALEIPAGARCALAQPDGAAAFCQMVCDAETIAPLIAAKKIISGT